MANMLAFNCLLQHGTHMVTANIIHHMAHYVKTRSHSQNWKYITITYCIVVREAPSHSHS